MNAETSKKLREAALEKVRKKAEKRRQKEEMKKTGVSSQLTLVDDSVPSKRQKTSGVPYSVPTEVESLGATAPIQPALDTTKDAAGSSERVDSSS